MKGACLELGNSTASSSTSEMEATAQVCIAVSRAGLLQNVSPTKKKANTKALIYTEG